MRGLTGRQGQVLDYIRQSITERGYPPTLREIGLHMGIRSTNGVNDHLRALENISRQLRDDTFCRFLKQARSAADIQQLLEEADNNQFVS